MAEFSSHGAGGGHRLQVSSRSELAQAPRLSMKWPALNMQLRSPLMVMLFDPVGNSSSRGLEKFMKSESPSMGAASSQLPRAVHPEGVLHAVLAQGGLQGQHLAPGRGPAPEALGLPVVEEEPVAVQAAVLLEVPPRDAAEAAPGPGPLRAAAGRVACGVRVAGRDHGYAPALPFASLQVPAHAVVLAGGGREEGGAGQQEAGDGRKGGRHVAGAARSGARADQAFAGHGVGP
mmetsp:Transcript_106761/g.333959  ORF Transcript_106761/g.333959 Transcript_106761/m.333959 type:complete len:233 (-) Transcript_106761:7-705(-)